MKSDDSDGTWEERLTRDREELDGQMESGPPILSPKPTHQQSEWPRRGFCCDKSASLSNRPGWPGVWPIAAKRSIDFLQFVLTKSVCLSLFLSFFLIESVLVTVCVRVSHFHRNLNERSDCCTTLTEGKGLDRRQIRPKHKHTTHNTSHCVVLFFFSIYLLF